MKWFKTSDHKFERVFFYIVDEIFCIEMYKKKTLYMLHSVQFHSVNSLSTGKPFSKKRSLAL